MFVAVLECDDVEVDGFVVCRRGGTPYPLTPGLVEGVVYSRVGARVLYRVSPFDLWPLRRLIVDYGDSVASSIPNAVVNVDDEPSGDAIPAHTLGIVAASRLSVARREYVVVEGLYVVGDTVYSGRLFLGFSESSLVAYGDGEPLGRERVHCKVLRAEGVRGSRPRLAWLERLREVVEGAGGVLDVSPVVAPASSSGVVETLNVVALFERPPSKRVRRLLRGMGLRYWGDEREWRAVVVLMRDYTGCLAAVRWD